MNLLTLLFVRLSCSLPSSRNLHTSPPSPSRRAADSPIPLNSISSDSPRSSRITEEMRTLGLQSPSRPGRRQGLEAGIVLVGGETDDSSSSSSDEEALARVVERNKSSPKKRRRARSPPSSSDSDLPTSPSRIVPSRVGDPVAVAAAAPSPTLPGMPDYESLAVTTLQRKVRQYGFRASKEKDVLVAQLRQVWIAMHPAPPLPVPDGGEAAETDASGGAALTDSPSPKKKTTASKAKAKATTAGRGRAKVNAKSKDDDENASDLEIAAPEADSVPGSTVGEKLRHLIVHDEGLYCRILRYEVRSALLAGGSGGEKS